MTTLGPDTKVKLSTVVAILVPLLSAAYWVYGVNDAVKEIPAIARDVKAIKRAMLKKDPHLMDEEQIADALKHREPADISQGD